MNNIPDIQSEKPKIPIPISKVVLTDVSLPSGEVVFDGRKMTLIPHIKAGVDLPSSQRGVHASRTYEVIKDAVEKLGRQLARIEDLAQIIAEELLRKHPYSSRSYVSLKASAYHTQRTPVTNFESVERIKILQRAYAWRNNGESVSVKAFLGVASTGMTACPCAKEVIRNIVTRLTGNNISDYIPLGTHMQRTYGYIMVEKFNGLKLYDLLEILNSSMSSKTFELLKREDEARIVIDAIDNPKFVEDVVREMTARLVAKYPHIPDTVEIRAGIKAMESIHSHNLEATITTNANYVKNVLGIKA